MKIINTDVVIIGAGPVGLFQVFELGLQGLKSVVIDSLSSVGGQCSELYPDKPIYDIPAIPKTIAKDIVNNLWQQASPFKPKILLSERVEHIEKQSDNDFLVSTNKNRTIHCKAVVIAAGNGAFSHVKLKIPAIEKFNESQIFYRINHLEQFRDQELVVLGGGDAALDWALSLQKIAANVVLIHRSTNFKASPYSVNKMRSLCEQEKMQFLCGQVKGFSEQDDLLTSISVSSKDGVSRRISLDKLLVCFGMSPKLGPIADWKLRLHQNQIEVDTQHFQTSISGIYAVGDINYYPGKRKLILSGFHEAALAAFSIASKVFDKSRIPTLYTTTSPVVHKRMGVQVELADLMD